MLSREAPDPDGTWAYGDDADQVADLYLPAGDSGTDRPTVLLVHGGFWRPEYDRVHLRPMAHALALAGNRVVLVEYARRPGDPDAGLADLGAALTGLPATLADSGVVAVGHSAGGHLALLLAAQSSTPLVGCLALAPVADLSRAQALDLDGGAVRAYLGGDAAMRPDLDPCQRPSLVPVTVLHGVADSVVPIALAESYCAQQPARLVRADCAHFEPIDPTSPAWPAVLRELAALAPRRGIE